jgi:hypothetical protein
MYFNHTNLGRRAKRIGVYEKSCILGYYSTLAPSRKVNNNGHMKKVFLSEHLTLSIKVKKRGVV